MSDSHVSNHDLQCVIVTPEATVLEGVADSVVVPLFDGEMGIYPQHAPLIGRLGYGELRISQAGKLQRFYIDGGFVQVTGSLVSVLTGRAVPAEKIDAAVANEQLTAAKAKPAHTPELLAIRDRVVAQARAQIHVAQKAR